MEKKADWSDYDSYILSVYWSPSSCFIKKENQKECFDTLDKLDINNSFIIHGLWPTYASGEETEDCNKDENINVSFNGEYKDYLSKFWPGLNYTSPNEMWNHEYNKHGYCYIQRLRNNPEKDYKIYFDKTQEMFAKYYDLMEVTLPDTPQGLHKVSKERFKYILNNSDVKLDPSTYSLRCENNKENNGMILSEIWFKYDFDFKNTSNVKSSDNCPERFDIYFRNENKLAVWEKYDFYVLTVLWPATYCIAQGKACYKKLKQKELNILTIHGLWPSYNTGVELQWCNLDVNVEINDYTKEMEDYWINTYEKNNKDFWNHQYNKHGYCYNKRNNFSTDDYMLYFNKTIEIYNKLELKNKMNKIFYPWIFPGMNKLNKTYLDNVLGMYYNKGNFGITCVNYNGVYYLHEIRIKLNLNFQPTTYGKTDYDCPEDFNAEFLEVEGPQKQEIDLDKKYNMYFFTILWLGTTCQQKGWQCYERIKDVVPKNKFTMHGLWPNLRDGTIPNWCNGKNDIEIEIKDKGLLEFMNKYYASGYHTNEYFWGHEYNKHGYCYNKRSGYDVKNYEIYFKKIRDMFNKNNFENLFLDFFEKEKIEIKTGDMAINRTKFELFFNEKGFSKDTYLIVCTNITNEKKINYAHISEMRIRYDLDFNLLKNETDKSEFDCPEIFYAQFFEE